jgi:hypothetical protein
METELQLQGRTRQRRVIALRKKLAGQPVRATGKKQGQACLPGVVAKPVDGDWYEYAVLVTSWEQREVPRHDALALLYHFNSIRW